MPAKRDLVDACRTKSERNQALQLARNAWQRRLARYGQYLLCRRDALALFRPYATTWSPLNVVVRFFGGIASALCINKMVFCNVKSNRMDTVYFTLRATRDLKIGVPKNPNLAKSGV
jgi:hypothetical protein